MGVDLDLLSRLLAYGHGRAMRIATHMKTVVQPDALVVSPLSMAGEDATIHIVAFGRAGQPPEILFVPDPRFREDQYLLFSGLGAAMETYYRACRTAGTHPQLWVSSAPAVALLDMLADRLRHFPDDEQVKRLGECLTYAAERYGVAGQQVLHAATDVLKLHWATGQHDGEDQHLGSVLTWIDPPRGVNVLEAVFQAQHTPMGVKTAPEFDTKILAPRIRAYHVARNRGNSPEVIAARAAQIREVLEPAVRDIYGAVQKAIAVLCGMGLSPLPGLDRLEERETREFQRFTDALDKGVRFPRRDRPKTAVIKMSIRQDAIRNFDAAVLCGDNLGHLEGMLKGHVLSGMVSKALRKPVDRRKYECRLELVSDQRNLHVRRGDELYRMGDSRLCVRVTDVQRQDGFSRILLHVTKGQKTFSTTWVGTRLDFLREKPDWDWLRRKRKRISQRLKDPPWTHEDGIPLPSYPKLRPPDDPIAAVEVLR